MVYSCLCRESFPSEKVLGTSLRTYEYVREEQNFAICKLLFAGKHFHEIVESNRNFI